MSRLCTQDLVTVVEEEGIVLSISRATVQRWLQEDARRPWRHRTWIFPRDPRVVARMLPGLARYDGRFKGRWLGPRDSGFSADEKPSIPVLRRRHPTTPPRPGHVRREECESKRGGVWAYLAAREVHAGQVIGRVEAKTGSAPVMRRVDQAMTPSP